MTLSGAGPLVGAQRALPLSANTDRVVTRYRVDLKDGLTLTHLGDESSGAGGASPAPGGEPTAGGISRWYFAAIPLGFAAVLAMGLALRKRPARP